MANTNYAAAPVAISDPALKRALLQHLLEQEQTSIPDDLANFLNELRTRPLRDFLALTNARTLRVSIFLGGVASSLQHLETRNDEEALLQYFVKSGASRKMLQRFFSISAEQAGRLCRAAGNLGGRPRLPDINERDRIHAAWHRLQEDPSLISLRDRMYALHQQFTSQPLKALEAVLNEFDSSKKAV